MANSKIGAIVRKVAENVKNYAEKVARVDSDKRLGRALQGVADALGAEGTFPAVGADGTEVVVSADLFAYYASVLNGSTTDLLSLSVEVNNGINKVKGYAEDELLSEDEAAIVTDTLALWEKVRGARKSPATSSRAQGERIAQADFNFPILATCDLCGEVAVRGGERTNRLDWNSLRHYSQQHAIKAHGTNGFTQLVSDAWRDAKESFKADGTVEVHVPGDADMPGFTLVRQ